MSPMWYIALAFGMAMDAFSVSICKGVSSKEKFIKTGLVCGAWFGGAQALMPLIGWVLGILFMQINGVETIAGFIAFALLAFLGGKMIFESFEKEECDCCDEKNKSLGFKTMFIFAIATSIDALATGVAIAMEPEANIWIAIAAIGGVTFLMSFIGSIIGAKVGSKYGKKAELVGGLILAGLAIKFLIDAIIGIC